MPIMFFVSNIEFYSLIIRLGRDDHDFDKVFWTICISYAYKRLKIWIIDYREYVF